MGSLADGDQFCPFMIERTPLLLPPLCSPPYLLPPESPPLRSSLLTESIGDVVRGPSGCSSRGATPIIDSVPHSPRHQLAPSQLCDHDLLPNLHSFDNHHKPCQSGHLSPHISPISPGHRLRTTRRAHPFPARRHLRVPVRQTTTTPTPPTTMARLYLPISPRDGSLPVRHLQLHQDLPLAPGPMTTALCRLDLPARLPPARSDPLLLPTTTATMISAQDSRT